MFNKHSKWFWLHLNIWWKYKNNTQTRITNYYNHFQNSLFSNKWIFKFWLWQMWVRKQSLIETKIWLEYGWGFGHVYCRSTCFQIINVFFIGYDFKSNTTGNECLPFRLNLKWFPWILHSFDQNGSLIRK